MSGYEGPNFTQIPNSFLDNDLPNIDSLAELKIVMVIMRKTFGWRKREDELSFSQFELLSGLSRQAVSDGIQAALNHEIITRRPVGKGFLYRLNMDDVSGESTGDDDRSKSLTSDSKEFRPETSKEFRPTKESSKETPKETTTEESPTGNVAYLDKTEALCMRLLKGIKNFPANDKETATRLRELRSEFDKADAEEVVKDFAAYLGDEPLRKRERGYYLLRGAFKHANEKQEKAELASQRKAPKVQRWVD